MRYQYFFVTDGHLKLLKRMYVGWDHCEFGAPAIDCKRPYGNSDVLMDMAEILDIPVERDSDLPDQELRFLHEEMKTVLQILVFNLGIEGGLYRAEEYSQEWSKVTP